MGLMMVAGITLLDIATVNEVSVRHARRMGSRRMYHDRTGFPKGLAASRGVAARHNGRDLLCRLLIIVVPWLELIGTKL